MATNAEINEQVAVKLGWTHSEIPGRPCVIAWCNKKYPNQLFDSYELPDYSGDISAAWEILDYSYECIVRHPIREQYQTWIHDKDGSRWENADTAAMAICLAFLKLP